jgi:putative membrane protein
MLETIAFALLEILLGSFTGLIPGIHVNTVVISILAILPTLMEVFTPHSVVALVIAMAVVHSYVDYIQGYRNIFSKIRIRNLKFGCSFI